MACSGKSKKAKVAGRWAQEKVVKGRAPRSPEDGRQGQLMKVLAAHGQLAFTCAFAEVHVGLYRAGS